MLAQVTLLVPHFSSPKNLGKSLLRYYGLLIFGALLKRKKKKNLIFSKRIVDFLLFFFFFFPCLKMGYNAVGIPRNPRPSGHALLRS